MFDGFGGSARNVRLKTRKLRLGVSISLLVWAIVTDAHLGATRLDATPQTTYLAVAKAYLQAVQARDFDAAYEFISSADRKILDKRSYLRGQRPLNGFALELAHWFAKEMQFRVIEELHKDHRVRLQIAYVIPSGDEITAQVLDWNAERLNALGQKNQSHIIHRLESLKKSGKMITIEGRETIELVREEQTWKVYENWRSRQRVMFRAWTSDETSYAVRFARNEILAKKDEPFQVDFTVTNRAPHPLWVHVQHSFRPAVFEKAIDMIACGSLVPFRLEPGDIRSIASVYLFRPDMAANAPITIAYRFTSGPNAPIMRNPGILGGRNR